MNGRVQPARDPRLVRDLARAIGKECRGETAVAGRGFTALREALERNGRRARLCGDGTLAALSGQGRTFDTLVLARALEYEKESDAAACLRRAWRLVGPQGRLVACVPNEDLLEDAEAVQRFTRRSFKKLLGCIDRPRLVATQPLAWLVMTIDAHQPPSRAAQERYDIMASLCRGNVLELGCGPGHLCQAVARQGLSVRGVDKNAGKVAKARELYPDIPFARADILALPGADRFDTVVLAEVLEHVPPELGRQMLDRAWERVAPGGRLVVSVPNEDCVPHPNHLQRFDREGLQRLLKPLGRAVPVARQPFKWLLMYVDRPA